MTGGEPAFTLVCPGCHSPLEPVSASDLYCAVDRLTFSRLDGIWRFLLPESAASFKQFIREYETVRQAEGRGSSDPAYYRLLPDQDLTGRFAMDWRARAASFQAFMDHILHPLEEKVGGGLKILDLGAGVGWLSNRLAGRGHHLAAIDLTVNAWDGLGAFTYYENRFTPLQADFNHIPLPDQVVDLAVFNASMHYATSFEDALRECLRLLKPGGQIAILDTPVYQLDSSGRQMVREREALFERRYGFPSNAIPSENYLTPSRLEELAVGLGIAWQFYSPVYELRWVVKRWIDRLRSRREVARFPVIAGETLKR